MPTPYLASPGDGKERHMKIFARRATSSSTSMPTKGPGQDAARFHLSMECGTLCSTPTTFTSGTSMACEPLASHMARTATAAAHAARLAWLRKQFTSEEHGKARHRPRPDASVRSFVHQARYFPGRVLASHQNVRKYSDWQRQFSDEQIKFLISRMASWAWPSTRSLMQNGWVRGVTKPVVTHERALENIDDVASCAGEGRSGSDLDGGFGYEQTPTDLNTFADLQKLPALLEKRGYKAADIAGFMHGNWLRFFGEVLPG